MGVEFTDEKLLRYAEIVAINSCVMTSKDVEGLKSLKVGKVYQISRDGIQYDARGEEYITIKSELSDKHQFEVANLNKYFIPMES